MPFREGGRPGTSQVIGASWLFDKIGACLDRDFRAYALVYITAGSGFYRDAHAGRCAVAAGDLLVLFPGLVHSYGPEAERWTEVWIGGRGPLFAALEKDGLLDRDQPVLHPGLDEGLIARFDALVAQVDRASEADDALLVARLHLLIAEVCRRGATAGTGGLVARARAALDADLRAPVALPALARRLGVGYDALRRAFLAEVGTTPGRWRMLRRIERVKDLLLAGTALDEIAAQTGFCDRFFLARQFRAVVGVPPGRWRDGMLGRR